MIMKFEDREIASAKGIIKKITEEHINEVTQIHIEALSGEFLPSLGNDFLRTLYRGILEGNQSIGFVYIMEEKVVGFVLASKDTNKLFKDVIQRRWPMLVLTALKRIINSPSLLPKIFETFFYPNKVRYEDNIIAELIVIAVDKKYRGEKIGKELINILNKMFFKEKIYTYKVVVFKNNKQANNFYKAVGFRFYHSAILYKNECNVYRYDISKK